MLQNATPLRKSAPGPSNISDDHVSCTALATENVSLQILFKCPTPAIIFRNATKPSRFAHFWHSAQSLAPATRNDIWTSKSGPNMFLTCASRHNGGTFSYFFDMSTSKSGPTLKCFINFDLEICFAPQRRALFRHHNFQTWSSVGVLCAFWLGHVLRATTACNFSSLIWPHGPAPAALASLAFRPSGATNHSEKHHSVSRLSYHFAHLDLLSSETFSFLIFFLLLFSYLTLPSLLFICPYCWKFDF